VDTSCGGATLKQRK